MYKSYEFSIEVWPGTVRIHQGYETEDRQTIELDPSQVESFYEALKSAASEAKSLGDEFEVLERELRFARANRAGDK